MQMPTGSYSEMSTALTMASAYRGPAPASTPGWLIDRADAVGAQVGEGHGRAGFAVHVTRADC
jgi:hypothetical protein